MCRYRREMSRQQEPRTFQTAFAMMQSRNPQTAEDGFGFIEARAHEHVDELLAALGEREASGDTELRGWLLELLSEAADARALPVFRRYLNDAEYRTWAVRGLQRLNTKDARQLLWEAGVSGSDDRG